MTIIRRPENVILNRIINLLHGSPIEDLIELEKAIEESGTITFKQVEKHDIQ